MAVDTETVQEKEATTEQAAAGSTLEQEAVAAEAVAETTPEPEAKAAETTTEATATTAEATAEIPGWDHDRQRRDEEAAEKRKELIRKEVAQQVAEVLAQKGATPAQQQAVIDDGAEIQKLLDDAERLSDEAQKKAEEDPYESAKLSAAAAKAATQANRKMLALNTQQAAVLKAREADEARKATVSAEWQAFQKRNPDIAVDKAQALADQCYQKAADGGYEGKNLRTRANELFLEQLPTLKKSSTPAPKPVQQTTKPKTATSASVSKPAGTKVTPSGSGVRPSAQQMGDAAAVLRKQLLGH